MKRSYGVATSLVTVDAGAPPGVFFKDPGERTTVYYYRAGSAASRLGPDLLPALVSGSGGVNPCASVAYPLETQGGLRRFNHASQISHSAILKSVLFNFQGGVAQHLPVNCERSRDS